MVCVSHRVGSAMPVAGPARPQPQPVLKKQECVENAVDKRHVQQASIAILRQTPVVIQSPVSAVMMLNALRAVGVPGAGRTPVLSVLMISIARHAVCVIRRPTSAIAHHVLG